MIRSVEVCALGLLVLACSQASAPGESGNLSGGTGGAPSVSGSAGASGAVAASGASSGAAGMSGAGSAVGGGAGDTAGGSAGMAAGGSAGSGGAPPGTCSGDCTAVVGAFDGMLFEYPCAAGSGCKGGSSCEMGALTVTESFTLQGDAAKVYRVSLRVRGITESKNYEGGTRRSLGSIDPGPAGGDLWYEGGTAPLSSYSSFELHVKPAVAGAPNDYYLNARDGTDEHDGTTWALNYSAEIEVAGGGTITFKTFDSNCEAIRNCGPKGASPCTPRTLDLSDAVPAQPAAQPFVSETQTPVQWLHIDVTGVEPL